MCVCVCVCVCVFVRVWSDPTDESLPGHPRMMQTLYYNPIVVA